MLSSPDLVAVSFNTDRSLGVVGVSQLVLKEFRTAHHRVDSVLRSYGLIQHVLYACHEQCSSDRQERRPFLLLTCVRRTQGQLTFRLTLLTVRLHNLQVSRSLSLVSLVALK